MLIEGEKYACDACVRGHRVSNCQHNDRPLIRINKKGRPVSQCPHCRGLRKSRASHVKCECGDKPHGKEDCVHLEKGDSKSEHGDECTDIVSDLSTVDHHICCCTHGARCTCALKKDHLDPVPETDVPTTTSSPSSTDSRKPRLPTAQSDGSLTVFTNGHHKPVHKNNHAAHECGLPYKIPRPHSIHGHPVLAQKSMDHLPLARPFETATTQLQESITSAQQDVRLVRSEHGSPGPRPLSTFEQSNGQLPQLDLSYSTFNNFNTRSMDTYSNHGSNQYESYLATPEEHPPFSATLSIPSVDWSTFNLPVDNGTADATYSQPPSYASFEHNVMGRPELTTSSSSETEDFTYHGLPSPVVPAAKEYSYPTPDSLGVGLYRPSSGSSFVGISQPSFMSRNNREDLSFDPFLQGGTASPSEIEEFPSGAQADPEAFIHHGLTVQDAQKMAHSGVPTEAMGDLTLPATRDDNDPLWAATFDVDETDIEGIEDIPDNVWRS
ncbi:hypothetical protein MMC27_005383 [Xylographa pallens]|nr:hypothetical protein [Xylographa pallens]